MNSIEMETIASALEVKQSWVVKGFNDFLCIWGKQTNIDSIKNRKIYLYVKGEKHYFIRCASDRLDCDIETEYGDIIESSSYPTITPQLARNVIKNLQVRINEFFAEVQKEIDTYSEAGQKIYDLIEKLK